MEVVEDYWSLDVVEAPDSSEFVESFEVVTQGEFGQDVPDMFPQSETVAPPEIFDWLPHSEGIAYTAEGNDPEPIESFVEKGSSGSGGCNASEHPAGGIELLLLALLGLLVGVVRWQWQSN
jgi:hypothetical protein